MRAPLVPPALMTLLLLLAGACSSPESPPAKARPVVNWGTPASYSATQDAGTASANSDHTSVSDQVERNWNLGSLAGSPDIKDMVIEMRIALLPDGTITRIDILNDRPGNPTFQQAAESAARAVAISSPLRLPPGKTIDSLVLRFHPGEVVQ